MAALTKDRNTPRREGDLISVPVKAATKIWAGSLVAVPAAGYAAPATKAQNLTVLGRAEEQVDNSDGADGDKYVLVRRGVFRWATVDAQAGAVTAAEIGKNVYIADDQTVDKREAASSVAGKCVGVDAEGVWVETR